MRTTIAMLIATLLPAGIAAQPPSPNVDIEYHGYWLGPSASETPRARERRRVRALAVRADYRRLLAADGGTLTRDHRLRIEREVGEVQNRN